LERAQGHLKPPDGRSLAGQPHVDKRHGTPPRLAALNAAAGKVTGRHFKRRGRIEFPEFMTGAAAWRDCHIHTVRANLSAHKPILRRAREAARSAS